MFPSPEKNRRRIKAAVRTAHHADIIVLVPGENELLCRESFAPTFPGDHASLGLWSQQNELFEALNRLGKPVVVCLMHGRPLDIASIADKADAVLDLWYAGQETGNALADVLFGDVNPSGKLTVTYPRSSAHLPVNYNLKPITASRDYIGEKYDASILSDTD